MGRITLHGTADLSSLSGIRDIQKNGESISFLYNGDIHALLQVLSAGNLNDLTIAEPDLEEIFLHYYETEVK